MKEIIIGTRGSKLALYQAKETKKLMENKFPEHRFVIEIIHTKGDKILDVALSKIGGKGLFTKEIEQALTDKKIDLAVHSMKDLPTEYPKGLQLSAVLKRGEARDALVSIGKRKLSELTDKDIIATSSVRRTAELLNYNPNFQIVDIRGNVDTRLKKWQSGYCTAMIMAGAGLQRLKLDDAISELLDTKQMVPAPAQGIIAIESRNNDNFINGLLAEINHKETWIRANAEYTFLKTLGGGCQVPIGCYTSLSKDTFEITSIVLSPNGKKSLKETRKGNIIDAEMTAKKMAEDFIEKGALQIIGNLENPL